jgi:hypothetical protein
MINRRFFISGIVSASAVASASQFLPVEWPKPYATVYGVGWDLEVVEHDVWTQQDALNFADFGRGGIDRFREITEIVYHVPMEPLPEKASWGNSNWPPRDPLSRFRYKIDERGHVIGPSHDPHGDKEPRYFVSDMEQRTARSRDPNDIWYFDRAVKDDGFTHIMGYQEMNDWRDSLRPDLPRDPDGQRSVAWVQEQIKAERDYEANTAKYIAEVLGEGAKNA